MRGGEDRVRAHRFGLFAERLAAWGLRLRGYQILARRYRTKVGEIDLIVRRGDIVAFVEVKARRDLDTALGAVTPQAQKRIVRAAYRFISSYPALAGCELRFDIVAMAPPFFWRHLDNAFRPVS